MALPLGMLLAHFLLFVGAMIEAGRLAAHRCPKCGAWLTIDKNLETRSLNEPDVITITKTCTLCDFESKKIKLSTENMGSAATMDRFIPIGKMDKKTDEKSDETSSR